MGGTYCNSCISCKKRQEIAIIYKRGCPKVRNEALVEALLPSRDTGLEGNVILDMGKWRQYQMEKYCAWIEEWNIQRGLWLGWNNEPLILTQIIDIKFQNLRSLSLDRNNIFSVEDISCLWVPFLRSINLEHNKITKIKPLAKVGPILLQKASLNHNPIIDPEELFKLGTMTLNRVYISFELIHLVKMDTELLHQIWIKRRVKDRQDGIIRVLRHKIPDIELIPQHD